MSDSKSTYGEPVEEPTPVDDVVGSANEGIASAEAAGRDAVVDGDGNGGWKASDDSAGEPAFVEPASEEPAYVEPAYDGSPAYEGESGDLSYIDTTPDDAAAEEGAATTVYETPAETVVIASEESERVAEPAYAEPAYVEPAAEPAYVAPVVSAAAAQPIFVQAPEAPTPRGNRGAAGAIGLLAALSFAILYLATWLGFGLISGDVTTDSIGTDALAALTTWSLWVPVVVFFIAFWLLGAIINRGRWGAWVIFGLLVGVASYGGHILGAMFQAPFWMLTASEGAALAESQLLAPLAIAAFVIGRELTIWFGAWVAARGARVTELNVEAQREYERTLEAGPQLTRV